jgi:hypothetical protein
MLLLLLNISLSRGSYQIYAQQARLDQLTEHRQALQEDLDARRAPQQLAERAVQLGMVPAGNPAYLRLSDGRVLGKARQAAAPRRPAAAPEQAEKKGAEQKAGQKKGAEQRKSEPETSEPRPKSSP